MVVVEAEDTDKLHIILNGVSIENKTSAAIYIQNADKVFNNSFRNGEFTFE